MPSLRPPGDKFEWRRPVPPVPEVGSIGPVLYGMQQETPVTWSTFGSTADLWKIAIADDSGEVVIREDNTFHCATPVYGVGLDKIIYQELKARPGGASPITTKLCLINTDGTGRTVIHDTGTLYAPTSYPARNDYLDYCMSPDGDKVAFVNRNNELRCVFSDGTGDCGGGAIATSAYGNPQWSPDSETIYISDYPDGIASFAFTGGSRTSIYAPNDLDYFWLSNDGTQFATSWFGGSSGRFTIIGVDGSPVHQYSVGDIPWTNPDWPLNMSWAPDDSFLLVDQQNHSYPGFGSFGIAVKTTPDLSDWVMYEPPTGIVEAGVTNWALALVDDEMKVLVTARESGINESSIYQFDAESGDPEGWLVRTNWNDPDPVWDRYGIGGQPFCTAFYGTQVWDA